ncbi:hypothetical protein FHETE_10615 [Fusarium heterosporum]|uniref:HNH nuclease domain-containing protein n=1 Tax=Fusarium heterosporum TaxID=42747 RepID=A0A8H5SU97_FUSHE|nr:hypothetical protein FHETE_10615 [Fusarium heterosporum]
MEDHEKEAAVSPAIAEGIRGMFERFDPVRLGNHMSDIISDYHDAPFEAPVELLPQEEIAERRAFGQKMEGLIRASYKPDFTLDMSHLAVISTVPISALRRGGSLTRLTGKKMYDACISMNKLSRHFMSKPVDGAAKRKKSDDRKVERNRKERKYCLKRDGYQCLITGHADPQVAHIVPHCFNNKENNLATTQLYFSASSILVSNHFKSTYEGVLANMNKGKQGLRGSDKVWNMVPLDLQMHWWWGEGKWAFKCKGIEQDAPQSSGDGIEDSDDPMVKVVLQFHYMPGGTKDRNRYPEKVRLQGDDDHLDRLSEDFLAFKERDYQPASPPEGTGKIEQRLATGERLRSGHLFYVRMPLSQAIKFKDMMELQWATIRLFHIRGAAEEEVLPTKDSDSEDDAEISRLVEDAPNPDTSTASWRRQLPSHLRSSLYQSPMTGPWAGAVTTQQMHLRGLQGHDQDLPRREGDLEALLQGSLSDLQRHQQDFNAAMFESSSSAAGSRRG